MKLAIVGGGSTYTPELIDGFARLRATLPIDEVWLVDPSEERVSLVAGISQRMFARAGHP
ncbi:MAG TPA: 6-phospho-beta-glucosidase, partial [Pseudolysinimonas sp.]